MNLTKILKKREFCPKTQNKMAIDLHLFFIYNYYGAVSGNKTVKTAKNAVQKQKIYI